MVGVAVAPAEGGDAAAAAGAAEAAWLVIVDNATGAVPSRVSSRDLVRSRSHGLAAAVADSVEPPNVYAELPGFRDPRFGLSDELFEIGGAIKLRCHVDEVAGGRRPMIQWLGGARSRDD